jgi:predicted dienelactone hydrolase
VRIGGAAALLAVVLGCAADDAGIVGGGETDTDADTDTDTDAEEPPAGPDAAPDPSAMGPYAVGVRTIELVDPDRMTETGAPRPITVEIWYPATEDARELEAEVYAIEDVLRPEIVADIGSIQIALHTEAVRDATPRADGAPYPLVMFSHGSSGVRMQSTYLTVALASHGYVVVAPDHYGNTLSDAILAGGQTDEMVLQSFGDRPIDLRVVLDHMQALPEGDPLVGIVDAHTIGVAGHSFGALTAVRWIGLGREVDAVVAQAPPGMELAWLAIADPLASFDTPLMLHVGGLDTTTPPADADSIWVEAGAPRSRLTLQSGGHFTFSDMCLIDRDALLAVAAAGVFDALDDGCAEANIAVDAAFPVLRHYAIGWFNLHLRGSTPTAALLTEDAGRMLAGDEVSFELEL